jgi:hypothetical protein
MEEVLCAMALKSANGRQTHHTKAGLPVCCEQALKGVGERNTPGGGGCRGLREPARAKEVALRGGGLVALLDIEGGDFWRRGLAPVGELLTGNIGSLRELAATKSASRSLRLTDLHSTPQYKILHCYIAAASTSGLERRTPELQDGGRRQPQVQALQVQEVRISLGTAASAPAPLRPREALPNNLSFRVCSVAIAPLCCVAVY